MKKIFNDARATLRKNSKNQDKTLVVIYVGGHGIIKENSTHVMLNINDKYECYLNFEQKVRELSAI